jgi:hypothetical protein
MLRFFSLRNNSLQRDLVRQLQKFSNGLAVYENDRMVGKLNSSNRGSKGFVNELDGEK